ncbi:hypothetical protein GCM10023322_83220 [Rugosimonospora acidiphila]|uniref:Uncharacterized protein n=1 Tax=Rugosimonospora acidiphila TaxID=556531 RepID=A0ABP9SU01_9ACTN
MNTLETQLAHRLHHLVDGEFDSTAPAGAVLDRGQRAGRRRATAMVATASLAVVAVGAVAAAGITQPWADNHPSAAPPAQTPRLSLAAAVASSQNTSYQVKVTQNWGQGSVDTTDGAFDPTTDTGYLNKTSTGGGVAYEERLLDGTLFIGSSGSTEWKQEQGRHDRLDYDRDLSGTLSASADPEQLFEMLRQSGAVISQTRTDSYHFQVRTNENSVASSYSGDVTVGADKRIATVTYQLKNSATKKGQTSTEQSTVTVALSGYGAPVTVDRPTDVVIVK